MMPPTMFLDESGFTGEDLFNADQPVFALATIFVPEDQCRTINGDHFGAVRARELKHSELCKRPRSQAMVLDFLRRAVQRPEIIRFSILHKRYDLVCQMVDWLAEPPMHEMGLNLYQRAGHIGLSNVLYYCVPAFGGSEFFVDLLRRFQDMMRCRTWDSYEAFFRPLLESWRENDTLDDVTVDVSPRFPRRTECGFRRLLTFPQKPFAVGLKCALALMGRWKPHHSEPVSLVHDASSSMAKERDIWDALQPFQGGRIP